MTATTIYLVPQSGPVVILAELATAHAGAAFVWEALGQRFLCGKSWPLWEERDWRRLFEYLTTDLMSFTEKAVFCSTLDYAVIETSRWPRMAEAYDRFAYQYDEGSNPCNLPAFARVLRESYSFASSALGVGFRHSSEAANPWTIYDHELDSYRPYDAAVDDRHWLLFDTLDKIIDDACYDLDERMTFLETFYNQRFQIHFQQLQKLAQ